MRHTKLFLGLVALCVSCSGPQDTDTNDPGDVNVEPGDQSTTSDPGLVQADVTASVTRQRLGELLGDGPAHLLSLVEVEGVVTDANDFAGWELLALPASRPPWFDVRVGDVVTAVNGMPLERPEDVFRVYQLLQVASEVRIDLIRGDESRAVRVAIEDEAAPEPDEGGEQAPAPPPEE